MPDSAGFAVTRAGAILAVSDFDASLRFYRDRPPWGGSRFFCVDPDGYLVEIEQNRQVKRAGV